MKKSTNKKALADGKNWPELWNAADAAIRSGIEHWPRIAQELLKRIAELEKEMQSLRQIEMFPSISIAVKPTERNGV